MFFPDWSGRGRARLGVLCILAFCLLLAGGCGSKQKKGQPLSMPSLIIPGDEGGEPLTPTELAAFQNTARIDRDIHKASMPDVVLQYKHFLRKGRGTMSVFSRNAEPYLGYARKVFRSRGMPEELAYLALVESGYRPDAESRVGALGAWQFMPYTGMKIRPDPGLVAGRAPGPLPRHRSRRRLSPETVRGLPRLAHGHRRLQCR